VIDKLVDEGKKLENAFFGSNDSSGYNQLFEDWKTTVVQHLKKEFNNNMLTPHFLETIDSNSAESYRQMIRILTAISRLDAVERKRNSQM
jgi:hypothetical protein